MNQKVWEKTNKMGRIKETYKGKEKERKARKNKYFQRYKTGNEEQKEWSPNVSISYNWTNPK